MKKVIVMLSLGVLFGGSTMAGSIGPGNLKKVDLELRNDRNNRGSSERLASVRTERMVRDLNLSNKQERQLKALNLKYADLMEDINRDDRSYDRRDNRRVDNDRRDQARMRALEDRYDAELRSILTPGQYKKYARNN